MPADRVGRMCEALGFESMWVCDHPILPVNHSLAPTRVDERVGIRNHQMPEYYRRVPDPFIVLTVRPEESSDKGETRWAVGCRTRRR